MQKYAWSEPLKIGFMTTETDNEIVNKTEIHHEMANEKCSK